MKMLDFQISEWWIVAVLVAVFIGIIWLVPSGPVGDDLIAILETPVKEMTVGHLTGLIVLAGMFLGR